MSLAKKHLIKGRRNVPAYRYGKPHEWAQSWWPEAWWLITTVGFAIDKPCQTCEHWDNPVCSSPWHQETANGTIDTRTVFVDRPAT